MKQDKIIHAPNDLLRRKARPVKFLNKHKVKRILRMFDLMYEENGIGLAAPQIGWNFQISAYARSFLARADLESSMNFSTTRGSATMRLAYGE